MQSTHKTWRKLVKKLQRKRKRQKAAKERDKKLAEEEATKQNDPAFQHWLQQQAALELCQKQRDEESHQEEEAAWLRRELIAQQQFRIDQLRTVEVEAEQEALRNKQKEELAAMEAEKRKRREERDRQQAAAKEEFENAMQLMEAYLANERYTEAPVALRRVVESKPSAKPCEFYERTNCCRFGMSCMYNHRRPLLSCIIIVRHFFRHPLLQNAHEMEYANADAQLELSERDLRDDYDEFFYDVLPELEKFGKIVNFRTTRNVLPHLRGHVFVEYTQERPALKAFVNLQGRYYAGKRLNVEFSSFTSWRGAICGLSFTRKCPKAHNCNYLHLFRNPENKYNTMLEHTKPKTSSRHVTPNTCTVQTPLLSWNDIRGAGGNENARNWRWSESPEVEVRSAKANSPKKGSHTSGKASSNTESSTESRNTALKHPARDRTTSSLRISATNALSAYCDIENRRKVPDTSRQVSPINGFNENSEEVTPDKNRKRKHSKSRTKESNKSHKKHKKESKSHFKRIKEE